MASKLVVPITFQIFQGENLVRTETIAQSVIKIGRDQKSHLRLEEDSVSRMHAVIEAKPDEVQIIDLGAGTQVNGASVNKCALKSGDEIKLGNMRLVIAVGTPVDASVSLSAALPVAEVAPAANVSEEVSSHAHSEHGHAKESSEDAIYQLIKRGDINPHEVEEPGTQHVEVSVLWKNSILHVAHLDGTKPFVLSRQTGNQKPTAHAFAGGLGAGTAMISAAAATGNYTVGALGALVALTGVGVSIALDSQNADTKNLNNRFMVGEEVLQGAAEMPVVYRNGQHSVFVFLPGSTGDLELDGNKRSLQDLINSGEARSSSLVAGGYEIEIRGNGRYRMEVAGLTFLAKSVARGRKVAAAAKRDRALIGAVSGSAALVAAGLVAMRLAAADDSGFLSQGNEEDRLAELRAFMQRQQDRQPEPEPTPQTNNTTAEGGTGRRHAGTEGAAGRRDHAQTNGRFGIMNRGGPPRLSRAEAREALRERSIFGAMGGPTAGAAGPVSPFGDITPSGTDERDATGAMNGETVADNFGYGGLGHTGTGWGGGGTGEGTIGMGEIGTIGHGSGTGSGGGYGSGAGGRLGPRQGHGPIVRAAPPQVSGLLSPEAIRRVVLRNLGQVSHCHEQGLAQNPQLEGRVVVTFIITANGTVQTSVVRESNLSVPAAASCIADAVRRWQFPSPEGGGIVTVNYPFNLQAPTGEAAQ